MTTVVFLVACGGKPREEYVDYFYSYKNDENQNSFTYILYIGEEGDRAGHLNRNEHSIEPDRQQARNRSESRGRSKSKDSDEIVPVAFRMEEEAFIRLEKLLAQKSFCSSDIEYTERNYTWLRYTIKGYCKE